MTCSKCNNETAPKSEFCREHWVENKYEERGYLDNSNPDDLGILKWARDMLPEYMPQGTPTFHIIILLLLFSLFDPFYKNRYERQRNIISFRGSSKSTLINFIVVMYLLCHMDKKMRMKNIRGEIIEVVIRERFIVIASETGNSAEDFVVRLRDELTVNTTLRYFYGTQIQDAYDAMDGQMTRRAFKFNGCFVMGAGVGQQIRGKIKGAYRATLILCDDIYSENNTITEDSRSKVKRWFDYAVLNSIDDLKGKIIVVGTILHEDTILVENKRAKNWKTLEFAVMPLELFQKFVSEHLQVNHQRGTCSLPFENQDLDEFDEKTKQRAYFKKVQNDNDWQLAWAERIDLYFLALKYQDAVTKRTVGSLYQEYFHEIATSEMKQIKPEYFRREDFEIYRERGYLFFKCSLFEKPQSINIQIGIDGATGTADGDDSAITISGKLSNGYEVIIESIYGKYPARDVKKTMSSGEYGRIEHDYDKIEIMGYIDEAIRKAIEYHADTIVMGYAGTEKTNVETLRQLTYINGLYGINVVGRKQDASEGDKRQRIAKRLAPKYQAHSIIHAKGLEKLEYQLEFLESCSEDDVADSAEVSLYQIQAPNYMDVQTLLPSSKEPIRFKKLALSFRNTDWRVN